MLFELTPITNSIDKLNEIKKDALVEIINFGTTVSQNTIFENIYKLLPGEKISINLQNLKFSKEFFSHNVNLDANSSDISSKIIHKYHKQK